MEPTPSSILILGSGVFGLSTALALTQRPSFSHTKITLIDRSPFPSPDGSSIDTSRIIRSDYSDPAYAKMGAEAMEIWRSSSSSSHPLAGLGEEGRYTESGLALTCNKGEQGEEYVKGSFENMIQMGDSKQRVEELKDKKAIEQRMKTGGRSGDWGYINNSSGWADAEAGMRFLRRVVEGTGRVGFLQGEATSLLYGPTSSDKKRVSGVKLADGKTLNADLVILATGAWTGKLVDLRGRATATGQVLCYLPISREEQAALSKNPVLLNMSTGMFIIPPSSDPNKPLLKVARHGYGYSNPTRIEHPDGSGEKIEVSIPRTTRDNPTLQVPDEGQRACRQALREMIPALSERPFTASKICWYTDTPKGEFLITYHPEFDGLFLATGGSGHGYKFLPVIGERILDVLESKGQGYDEFAETRKWTWPESAVETVVTEDGSRGGKPGMVLSEEIGKGGRL
ncbi:related to fructosyl amino acid oxidase [Phialocephala subalpina]|uniref:Related to fructosyl amino acid oxidase n=1 Tax=Phialocephala subalpina TaxID=576137 RepID=A0A1L7X7N3_9HELO|nr:related to fructosyl amino acid oxidase [Phialocephala subalpina]